MCLLCVSYVQVIVGQSIGLLISTAIADIFTAQSFSFVLILSLMLFGEMYHMYDDIVRYDGSVLLLHKSQSRGILDFIFYQVSITFVL